MIKTNYHSHTTRCKHAVGSDEAYVLAAIEAGLDEIGFSDHAPWPKHPLEEHFIRMHMDEYNDYVQSIMRLKRQYANKIKIRLGLEAEYYEDRMDVLKKFIDETPLDYVVFGNHFHQLEINGCYYGRYQKTNQLLEHYEQDSIAGLKTGYYKIFAHPDLFVRSIKQWDENVANMSRRIIQCAKDMGVVLEYNLGGIRNFSHVDLAYPFDPFWDLVAEIGADVVIGVDAHDPEDFLDFESIARAEKTLKQKGIKVLERLSF